MVSPPAATSSASLSSASAGVSTAAAAGTGGGSGSAVQHSGRERAIEMLIDMEPQGDYYRAARVMDEAVPMALSSRPNVVTRTALVEQAHGLMGYEISTLSQYEQHIAPPPKLAQQSLMAGGTGSDSGNSGNTTLVATSSSSPSSVSNVVVSGGTDTSNSSNSVMAISVGKDRVLRHYKKILNSKRKRKRQEFLRQQSQDDDNVVTTTNQGEEEGGGAASLLGTSTDGVGNDAPKPLLAILKHLGGSALLDADGFEEPNNVPETAENTTPSTIGTTEDDLENQRKGETWKALIDTVMEHPIWQDPVAMSNVSIPSTPIGTRSSTPTSLMTTDRTPTNTTSLEGMLSNLCREGQEDVSGLLMGALSILIGSVVSPEQHHQQQQQSLPVSAPTDEGSMGIIMDEPEKYKSLHQHHAGGANLHELPSSSEDVEGSNNDDDDVMAVRRLQAASVLSLLQPDAEAARGPFSLDTSILAYLKEAAQVYEERIEIQTQRLLQKRKQKEQEEGGIVTVTTSVEASATIPIIPLTPVAVVEDQTTTVTGGETQAAPAAIPSAEGAVRRDEEDGVDEEDEDPHLMDRDMLHMDDDDDDVPSAISAAVFDRIISAVTGGGDNDDDDDTDSMVVDRAALQLAAAGLAAAAVADNSSDDDDDSDDDHDDDDSSHEGPAADGLDDDDHIDEDDDDDDDDSSEDEEDDDGDAGPEEMPQIRERSGSDDDDMLRQALALSLEDHAFGDDDSHAAGDEGNDGPVSSDRPDGSTAAEGNDTSMEDARPEDGGSFDGDENGGEEEEEEEPLPPLPEPPSFYPYANILVDSSEIDSDHKDSGAVNEVNQFLDPAALTKFGMIPSSYAMVHLLRSVLTAILRKRRVEKEIEKEKQENCVLPGGIGCSLFVAQPTATEAKASAVPLNGDNLEARGMTFQLLVVAFILMTDNRSSAIEALKRSIEEEQRHAQEFENSGFDDPLLEGEEDDPAMVLAGAESAMASADPSSSTLSRQSLEEKGMHRKARAAAHEAAVRLKSLRKKTDGWKEKAKLFSYCSFLLLKSVRAHLQSDVATWLKTHASDPSVVKVSDYSRFLPDDLMSRLVHALAELGSITLYRSFATLIADDEGELVEDLLMPLRLYRESVATWGECTPILCKKKVDQIQLLQSLIKDCASESEDLSADFAMKSIVVFPLNQSEVKLHQLNSFCRRLCVSDLLDSFVVDPGFFNGADYEIEAIGERTTDVVEMNEDGALSPSAVLEMLTTACASPALKQCTYLERFHHALCHKLTLKGLLWDGLYAIASDDGADSATPGGPVPTAQESIRVSPSVSSSLAFDSLKCSDSIAIIPNDSQSSTGSAAHQRASKVWGTVLSSAYFSPKTGVHRWAVRLDKCERGHVFVGVATSQASMRTYVGGDKYGWGVIGTQALWHDRRKIRGDYGGTFRSGSTIIVTLDTDAGTLGFSSLKDTSGSSNAFSLDALLPSLTSPRRQGQGAGTLDEWGVAFEGLPLDAKLYPAVGLYQRDDKVTLLNVETGSRSSSRDVLGEPNSGSCYYPLFRSTHSPVMAEQAAAKVRRRNDALSLESTMFVKKSLQSLTARLKGSKDMPSHLVATIPTLASALALLPSTIPVLSERFALALLPDISSAILALNRRTETKNLFTAGLVTGKWMIRATGMGGNTSEEYEEYLVDFTHYRAKWGTKSWLRGSGVGTTGKSKNGLVSISGAVCGSSVKFVEEWRDTTDDGSRSTKDEIASACVVGARISIDGTKFEGTYRNVQFGTTGHIAGVLLDAEPHRRHEQNSDLLFQCQTMLCLAHGHLVGMLAEDSAGDHKPSQESLNKDRARELDKLLSGLLLSIGMTDADGEKTRNAFESLRSFYSTGSIELPLLTSTQLPSNGPVENKSRILDDVIQLDGTMATKAGGFGSLALLCFEEYKRARHMCIAAIVHHSGLSDVLRVRHEDERLAEVWRSALRVMEDGVRIAILSPTELTKKEKAEIFCKMSHRVSSFLLEFDPSPNAKDHVSEVVAQLTSFQSWTLELDNLSVVEQRTMLSARKAWLRLLAVQEVDSLLEGLDADGMLTSPVVLETVSLSLPKLFGRPTRKVPRSALTVDADPFFNGIGGFYLHQLDGCGQSIRNQIGSDCNKILLRLTDALTKVVDNTEMSQDQDSLCLALLPVFIASYRDSNKLRTILQSGFLDCIKAILQRKRPSLRSNTVEEAKLKDDKEYLSNQITLIVRRDTSRAVLRCAVSAVHVITYQLCYLLSCKPSKDTLDVADSFFLLLAEELKNTFPFAREELMVAISSYERESRDRAFNQWVAFATDTKGNEKKKKYPSTKNSKNLVVQLLESGTLMTAAVPVIKSSKPTKSPPGEAKEKTGESQRSDDILRLVKPHLHHYISHWMHILACVVKKEESLLLFSKSEMNLRMLFATAGVSESTKSHLQDVPGRYRSRLLRLVAPVLRVSEPNRVVVEGLFDLSGRSNSLFSSDLDNNEAFVSRESVSLLRTLYHPRNEGWRSMINSVVETRASVRLERNPVQVGVMHFLSGPVHAIHRGALVLLKPPEAAALTNEATVNPGSKSHSGSSSGTSAVATGVSHHVVGSGTGAIMAGLCRNSASAGVVSSIDTKTSVCEIILMDRVRKSSNKEAESSRGGALTVRALRTPMSDVAMAQEMPLLLDPSFPGVSLLLNWLSTSASQLIEEHRENTGLPSDLAETGDWQLSILMIRSSLVLLADERILSQFLQNKHSRGILSKLLELAIATRRNGNTENEPGSLSALPIHEARYSFILRMLREVELRSRFLNATDDETWTARRELFAQRSKKKDSGIDKPISSAGSARSGTGTDAGDRSTGRGMSTSIRQTSRSSASSNNSTEDEEESEAAATAAAHLREAAIAQMAELGLPRSWSELALRRTGGTNIEAAVHFCLERGGDMERLIAEERERERLSQRSGSRRRGIRTETPSSTHLLRQLLEMGFPRRWCEEALSASRNNVDEALTWILTNGERLSAEDEGMEEEEDENADDQDEDDDSVDDEEDEANERQDAEGSADASNDGANEATATEETNDNPNRDEVSSRPKRDTKEAEDENDKPDSGGWKGSVTPIRFISGRSIINPKTLAISGLPTGGFSSVGTKGVLLTSGKWYYEAILETAGCLQIGWADGSFSGHCHADRGDGCGDGPSSWAYDGWRRYRWHASATEWGCRWREGDVVGCLVDMDKMEVGFTLNGRGEDVGMGTAFSGRGFRPCGGVYACVSFNRREKLRLILGGEGTEPFKFKPPPGYRGVGEAVLEAVYELEKLIEMESVLDQKRNSPKPLTNRFLCDFSDGEHGHELYAWQHRYYGSDASVHLGSGRSGKQGSNSKHIPGSSTGHEISEVSAVSSFVEEEWESTLEVSENRKLPLDEVATIARKEIGEAYKKLVEALCAQFSSECQVLSSLYSRKVILQLIVSLQDQFDLSFLYDDAKEENSVALDVWSVLDSCVGLQSSGWGGEAGAMAIAAEALGLGISSTESNARAYYERFGVVSCGKEMTIRVPIVGLSQLLSSIITSVPHFSSSKNMNTSIAACAEAAIGGDGGGGPLMFLLAGLQGAVIHSKTFTEVLVAVVRRSIRLLAVVDYGGDDAQQTDDDDADASSGGNDHYGASESPASSSDEKATQPDARLTCFLSGLLLSYPVISKVENSSLIMDALLEAWSVGLLSASAPWRMVCALTAAGILNMSPSSLASAIRTLPTIARYFGRLPSTVSRRVWAERAAVPVCSRYSQALVELITAVKRSYNIAKPKLEMVATWDEVSVDAATPIPLNPVKIYDSEANGVNGSTSSWEWCQGWALNDNGWDVWGGTVQFSPMNWKPPNRSAVRTLMDGGEGPPMLREGCVVMRGVDWEHEPSGISRNNEDGKDRYELEKAEREREKKALEEQAAAAESEDPAITPMTIDDDEGGATGDEDHQSGEEKDRASTPTNAGKKKKKKKIPNPKLPVGIVTAIEPWQGVPAMGRRVRWNLTGVEELYRYGGDGGRYDIAHVEINEKGTRVKKRHPLPESAEQCASRHGFGNGKKFSVILRIKRQILETLDSGEDVHEGIMELPDFSAGILVRCTFHGKDAVTICEEHLLYGSKDSGWEPRFGHPSYVCGTETLLSLTGKSNEKNQAENDTKSSFLSTYEELLGSSMHESKNLRSRGDGQQVKIVTEMKLLRERQTSQTGNDVASFRPASKPPPLRFDRSFHASSMSMSPDGKTVTCISPDGRGTAFGTLGFSKGAHYWEVKLEQADIGSVFIGVAEKPVGSGSGSSFGQDNPPRLNRWLGWGFVNFRATYTSGAERVYGAHCHNDDTVGVLLDCDAGRISFFYDGLKYGEHILNDLGCAFENVSPFGFNADGCGSGGAGQGAPSGSDGGRGGRYPAHGAVRPRTLWPVIGLRNPGDRVTFSSKYLTSTGGDGVSVLRNVLSLDEVIGKYEEMHIKSINGGELPEWFISEAFSEYQRWTSGRWKRAISRGSGPFQLTSYGLDIDLDCSPIACATACAGLGLRKALLSGDRVIVKRSAGRQLEMTEEAVILGAYQGRLFYRLVSQKSEGGSLTEGGGRAWFWDESEVVNDSLQLIGEGRGLDIDLPFIDRFRCLSSGGLKVVYPGGAVVRSDIEIFDRSQKLGSVPCDTVIAQKDVLERRVSSCGIVRYRIRYKPVGEGWISSRIRGGIEEAIVEPVESDPLEEKKKERLPTPLDSALVWYESYKKRVSGNDEESWIIGTREEFKELLRRSVPEGVSVYRFDSMISSLMGSIADFTEGGDAVECSFSEAIPSIEYAVSAASGARLKNDLSARSSANQAAASVVARAGFSLPDTRAVLARIAMLRAMNRRARYALSWMCVRPSQEGSAILGGLCGHGASVDRAGRNKLVESMKLWVQVPSIGSKLRKYRCLFFSSVKRALLDSITSATTTPTPLSHDEYELPREIRTVRVNRLKARRAMAGDDDRAKRKHSVFSQLMNETRNWGGAPLRRGFVAKGHGGQKRAFKVKLIGEGVNDYSGPYREVFTDALREVVMYDDTGKGVLGILDPTPNHSAEIGDDRDLFMFSLGDGKANFSRKSVGELVASESSVEARIRESFAVLSMKRDEASREVEEGLVFLGRLVGTACRHGIPVDLPLPMKSVWECIAEDGSASRKDVLGEIDLLASRQEQELQPNTKGLLLWQQRMLNSFVDGLANVLPIEVLTLLTGEELQDMLCGNADVDVALLQRVVEYEGFKGDETTVEYFWEALREMTLDQRKQFLQFVWARSRLPSREADFEAPFKLIKDPSEKDGDSALPSASTCFFSLTLPEYTSKQILKEKLLFAVENVCTMESDYVTNDAEVGEGWRGL